MALFQVIYMSSLVDDEPEILSAILDSSVRNNKRSNITGMLLYADGNVMQVLEGEKDVVLEAFHAIELDVRHHGILLLVTEAITSRMFSSWSMGFRQLTKVDLEKLPEVANIFRYRPEEIAVRVQPSQALAVLKSFATSH